MPPTGGASLPERPRSAVHDRDPDRDRDRDPDLDPDRDPDPDPDPDPDLDLDLDLDLDPDLPDALLRLPLGRRGLRRPRRAPERIELSRDLQQTHRGELGGE